MSSTEIRVTAKHIANGERGDAKRCPVSLAITEHLGFKGNQICIQYYRFIRYTNGKRFGALRFKRRAVTVMDGRAKYRSELFWLSKYTDYKIRKLDKTGKMKPFTAKLNVFQRPFVRYIYD